MTAAATGVRTTPVAQHCYPGHNLVENGSAQGLQVCANRRIGPHELRIEQVLGQHHCETGEPRAMQATRRKTPPECYFRFPAIDVTALLAASVVAPTPIWPGHATVPRGATAKRMQTWPSTMPPPAARALTMNSSNRRGLPDLATSMPRPMPMPGNRWTAAQTTADTILITVNRHGDMPTIPAIPGTTDLMPGIKRPRKHALAAMVIEVGFAFIEHTCVAAEGPN